MVTVSLTKPVARIFQLLRLLDRLPEFLRDKHYSLRREEAYLYWVKLIKR